MEQLEVEVRSPFFRGQNRVEVAYLLEFAHTEAVLSTVLTVHQMCPVQFDWNMEIRIDFYLHCSDAFVPNYLNLKCIKK